MPDKRDMHKAKSHRNSKSAKQQQNAAQRSSAAGVGTTTMAAESESPEVMSPGLSGKKNKSRR